MSDQFNPVNWFEIPASDIERAKSFYEAVLGHELQRHDMGPMKMAWFPMHDNAIGCTGTIVEGETYDPSMSGSMVYFQVPDIDATLERISSNGGEVLNPKTSIGEYGFVAHFKDSEGNRVALHSEP